MPTKAANDPKTKICRACCKIIDHPVSLFDPNDKENRNKVFRKGTWECCASSNHK